RKVTPLGVAQLEAPSFKDWKALRSEPGQQELVDRVEVVGWLGAQRSSQGRPHTLSFLVLPEDGLADELADRALAICEDGPAWSSSGGSRRPASPAARSCSRTSRSQTSAWNTSPPASASSARTTAPGSSARCTASRRSGTGRVGSSGSPAAWAEP